MSANKKNISSDDILKAQFPYITEKQRKKIIDLNVNPFLFKYYNTTEYLNELYEEFNYRNKENDNKVLNLDNENAKEKELIKNNLEKLLNIYPSDPNSSKSSGKNINNKLIFFEVGHLPIEKNSNPKNLLRKNYNNEYEHDYYFFKVYLDPNGNYISNGILECLIEKKSGRKEKSYRNKDSSDNAVHLPSGSGLSGGSKLKFGNNEYESNENLNLYYTSKEEIDKNIEGNN